MTATYAPTVFSTQIGIQGPPGNGAPGTTTRDGAGAPSNTLGIDGEYYTITPGAISTAESPEPTAS